MPGPIDEVLAATLPLFERARLAFGLTGGYAVNVWGVPRVTFDVNLLVACDAGPLNAFLSLCQEEGFEVGEGVRRDAAAAILRIALHRGGRPTHIELYPAVTPLQVSALGRLTRAPALLGHEPLPVVTAADLILFKLLAHRPKDRVDIDNILAVQGLPEPAYLFDWARQLGLADRLELALQEAGLGP